MNMHPAPRHSTVGSRTPRYSRRSSSPLKPTPPTRSAPIWRTGSTSSSGARTGIAARCRCAPTISRSIFGIVRRSLGSRSRPCSAGCRPSPRLMLETAIRRRPANGLCETPCGGFDAISVSRPAGRTRCWSKTSRRCSLTAPRRSPGAVTRLSCSSAFAVRFAGAISSTSISKTSPKPMKASCSWSEKERPTRSVKAGRSGFRMAKIL